MAKKVILIAYNGFPSAAGAAVLLHKYPHAEVIISSARRISETLATIQRHQHTSVHILGVGIECPFDDVFMSLRNQSNFDWRSPSKTDGGVYWYDPFGYLVEKSGTLRSAGVTYYSGGNSVPELVAEKHRLLDNPVAKKLIAESTAADSNSKIFRLIEAGIIMHLKFQDPAPLVNAIRKIADPDSITNEDWQEAIKICGFSPRILRGKSKKVSRLRSLINKVGADPDCRILITGETGTGKETVARLVHERSRRNGSNFVALNCANFDGTLLDSELFGHVKGAFTGAHSDKDGLFKFADKGTVFLDEVAEMPLDIQAKLLRVLEDGRFFPVGSLKEIRVDVRLIAATNRDLPAMIRQNKFREDLYFRLNCVEIRTLPLREIPEDIPLIAEEILYRLAQAKGMKRPKLTQAQRDFLLRYQWPGNVRELQNVLESSLVLEEPDFTKLVRSRATFSGNSFDVKHPVSPKDVRPLAEIEREYIARVYELLDDNKARTAAALDITVNTLKQKLATNFERKQSDGASSDED